MRGEKIFAKCAWRLMPLIALIYLVNILDRVNVGFAALTINRDLGFSPSVYGFGAGLFFIGYLLFQVPSNLILERVGAHRWIFCILAAWGVVSSATLAVHTPGQFYAMRILLGLAEAGFYPGMMLYMTYWFPPSYRARFVARLIAAGTFAFVIGGPFSGLILGMEGVSGLHGWQWLFLIEGIPAVVLAVAVLLLLPDGPAHASWLTDEEKQMIGACLPAVQAPELRAVWPAMRDLRVLALSFAYVALEAAQFGVLLWLPQIVQSLGFSNVATSLLVACPSAVAILVVNLWAYSSDKTGEHVRHVVIPALLVMTALIAASLSPSPILSFLALSVGVVSLLSIEAPFWAIPSAFLKGTAAAAGFAFINAVGTGVGGFLGPAVIGLFKEGTGDYSAAMAALALAPAITSAIVIVLGRSLVSRPALAPGPAASG